LEDAEYGIATQAQAGGFRSVLSVPMLRERRAIGGVTVGRPTPGRFSENEVALLQTFADQAVIAIENARLFAELQHKNEALTQAHAQVTDALERQTATAEILRVINTSQLDLNHVFDVIARNAARLCDADLGGVILVDNGQLMPVGSYGFSDVAASRYPRPVDTTSHNGRAIVERRTIHVPDIAAEPSQMVMEDLAQRRPLTSRSQLSVPMMRGDTPIGVVVVARNVPGPFAEAHIDLLRTFADQAAIASGNARLFNETKEALEQQTATGDILKVIASSPTDIQPVLDTVVRSATRLCEAYDAMIALREGERLSVGAHHGPISIGWRERPISRGWVTGRTVVDRQVIHVHDLAASAAEYPLGQADALEIGHRTTLGVPLLREGEAIGVILIRRLEVRPFSEKQIRLLQTFANQAVIAIENVRLFKELEASNRDLTEALDQQTATGEILRVISSSPTDLRPVLDAVAEHAARLCAANDAQIFRVEDEFLRLAASYGPIPEVSGQRTISREWVTGRSVVDRRTIHVHDLASESDVEYKVGKAVQRQTGHRTTLATPLLREGVALGAILIRRMEVLPFSEKQVRLLETFADQAVIAIENVRLFTELQEKNQALTQAHAQVTEALEQQTATSDILRVISQSQTDVQPVFDAIVNSAVRLLRANTGVVIRIAGELIELAAFTSIDEAGDAVLKASFPRPVQSEGASAQAIRDRAPVNIADAHTDPRFPEAEHARARARGYRSRVVVPMLGRDQAIGAIGVTRREPGGFTDDEIALLQTFADQAVIAIENVRLFTELQEKNRALTEALEQQTATSQILRVISSSPTDIGPVLDAVAQSAARLCEAYDVVIRLREGDTLCVAAHHGPIAIPSLAGPRPISRDWVSGRAVLERQPVHVHDLAESGVEFPLGQAAAVLAGHRTTLAVPLLREDEAIGVILIRRRDVRPFTGNQIALLQTFADQAVIAIENVHLFQELQTRTQDLTRSVGELRALGEVSQAVNSTLELGTVLETIVSRAVQLSGSDQGIVYEFDEGAQTFHARAMHRITPEHLETVRAAPIRLGEGAIGQAGVMREPVQVADIQDESQPVAPQVRELLVHEGMRSLLAMPLVREQRLLGGLVILRAEPGAFSHEVVAILKTFATQSVLAIQNARLFREIEDKSRQLEVASQHKSEFLANMSHELRTPLNAIIGFSEVLTDRMFGELNEKQEEYLKDIYASGTHLLSLINDILDLSKIEAGRMELELTDFHLPTALDNALTLVRERAGRRSITLQMNVDERLGEVRADERKIRQVVLNLLSNAIKFTSEGGRIEVAAVPRDESVEVSVSDTGVGIAPEDQEAVFEEFRQVGTAAKKVEGTGLGLTLCRKFVELHGGRIWVKSEVGVGSTFTFTLPVRRGE
jgi:GAF domain-containing protein